MTKPQASKRRRKLRKNTDSLHGRKVKRKRKRKVQLKRGVPAWKYKYWMARYNTGVRKQLGYEA